MADESSGVPELIITKLCKTCSSKQIKCPRPYRAKYDRSEQGLEIS